MIVRSKANELLEQLLHSSGTGSSRTYYYIGLHSYSRNNRTPKPDGSHFDEPVIPTGQTFYDEDGNEVQVTVNEYQRVSLKDVIGTSSDGMVKNDNIIFFNEAEHYPWGRITHFGIFTSATGGTPIFWGQLAPNSDGTVGVNVNQYYIPIFRAGKLQIGLDQDPANPVRASDYTDDINPSNMRPVS